MSQPLHSTQMFEFLLCPVGSLVNLLSHSPWSNSLCKSDGGRGVFVRVRADVTGQSGSLGVAVVMEFECVCGEGGAEKIKTHKE